MKLKYYIPMMVLALGFTALTPRTYAKLEFTKKEKKACTFCHVAQGKKELNDAGKYYKDKGTLEGLKK